MRTIFFIILTFTHLSIAKVDSFKKLRLDTGLGIDVAESQILKARVLGFYFGIESQYNINDEVMAYFNSVLLLENGSNEVLGTNIAEFEPIESIQLLGGGIIYKPSKSFNFELAAMNQDRFNSPLLVGQIPFVGISEKLFLGSFYLKAQQSIPNNNFLSRRIGTIETGTPLFLMSTLGLLLDSSYRFIFEASHFKYADISPDVAQNSRSIGNSVSGVDQGAQFLYDFEGSNVFSKLTLPLKSQKISFGMQYLFNEKAPEGRNKGILGFISLEDEKYTYSLENYRNESDSSIAFYNDRNFGHNNITGTAASVEYRCQDYTAFIRMTHYRPIENAPTQDETTLVSARITRSFNL